MSTWNAIVRLAQGAPITAEIVEEYVLAKLEPADEGAPKKQKKAKGGKVPSHIKTMIGWIENAREKVKAGETAGLVAILDRIEKKLKTLKLA